jgi:hypothetical protein
MNLQYLKTSSATKLRDKIEENLSKYQNNEQEWLGEFFGGQQYYLDTNISVNLPTLAIPDSRSANKDVENVKVLHYYLRELTPQQALDNRLWEYYCHTKYWNYMIHRWPSDNESKILDRYFIKSSSSRSLIRNGISRLWWFGHLTYDPNNKINPYDLLDTLLKYQDIQAAVLERSFGKNNIIRKVFLKTLKNNNSYLETGNAKLVVQRLGKYVNRLGGVGILDVMDEDYLLTKMQSFLDNNWK